MEYPDGNHVLIRALDELTGYVGAAFNVPLEVVSCTDEEIILDGPIKPYIWQEWKLDEISEYQNIIYLGIESARLSCEADIREGCPANFLSLPFGIGLFGKKLA